MSASTSQSTEDVKVEKGPEGELKKTISTVNPPSAETTTRKDDEKSTFRGPDSGSVKVYSMEELKKLKVTLEIKKRKPAVTTSGAAIDLNSITPVRRPDPVTAKETESSITAEDVGVPSGKLLKITEGQNEPVIEELKIHFPAKRKYLSECFQFERACKCPKKNERYRKEYDAIGYAMSKKLLRMDSTQAIYAESLMNKILELGLLEQLSSSTKIKNDRR